MFNFPFSHDTPNQAPETFSEPRHTSPAPLPWESNAMADDDADKRLAAMEQDEPKRRLIRDARALCKLRKITQAQMAEEIGVPRRTAEEWLQFRRVPKAPGTTLIRRWVDTHRGEVMKKQ
ncbi:hypothetical protein [Vreelandella aquamarina]|uniref:hypothetical protein n=1 Tax=Vreelandella aquamarina TaxID=77097 RepID=UPI0038515A09